MNTEERYNLIKRGQSLKIARTLISAYSDGSVSIEYVTRKGVGGNWGDMIEFWPIFDLGIIDVNLIKDVCNKINLRSLLVRDIKLTPFYKIYKFIRENGHKDNINSLFKGLTKLTFSDDGRLYMFLTEDNLSFHTSLESLTIPFENFCDSWGIEAWGDLSDTELISYIDRLETDFEEMQCSTLKQ